MARPCAWIVAPPLRTFRRYSDRDWYIKHFSDFLDTPLGTCAVLQQAVFFICFAFSGWLFRVLIFTIWMLPIAGPLLIGTLANNIVIKGACPACKRQFVGNKSQIICCAGCGNTMWQPKGNIFSRGGGTKASRKSTPRLLMSEFEEK